MSANPLVVERKDTTSPLAGTLLLEDGDQLVQAVQNGDWISGGMAAFSGAMDTVAAVSDPLGTVFAMGFGWVIDHVSPLNTWLEELTGDADQVTAFAGTWANVSTSMQESADELTRIVAADLEAMDGATISAYRAVAGDMARHLSGASRWAGAMSTALGVATTLVQIVHDIVRDAIAQVLGAVASFATELVCTVGLAAPLVIEQATTRAASLATRIGKHLTNLLSSFHSLEGMLRDLRRLLDDLGDEFGKLFHHGGAGGGHGVESAVAAPEAPHGEVHGHPDPALPKGAERAPDTSLDPEYGLPRHDAGQFPDWLPPDPAKAEPGPVGLGADPAHPWGHDPKTGNPLTAEEWRQRYIGPDNRPRWPPNDGAVPGSRHTFTNLDDFRAAYGSDVDRIGEETGEYLGVPPGSSWGERGLQPGSMVNELHGYQLTGDLPSGWHIEVSKIAEAFGQPGGGIQALVRDDAGRLVSIEDLRVTGVLK